MNLLGREKSAYLQQHAANPVHWQAWSPEAFQKAASENKPVLISIGYSTCHWCHVMEHESFEDAEVAQKLNDSFVAIKVDREEHPDVDQFYMDALHTMVARGGWPLNILTTPDRMPFFGGTYFPKAQFLQLLTNVDQVWREDPKQITEQGKKVVDYMKQGRALQDAPTSDGLGSAEYSRKWTAWIKQLGVQQLRSFDPIWGGFGGAPKFPRSHATSALLRSARVAEDKSRYDSLVHAVGHSLKAMAFGGIWDHLGGGFHRYSTDEEWHVPHFEKMLYDQALLVQTYSEYFLETRAPLARVVVEGLLDYLETEMRLPSGAWAAAQDADTEGVEGKFFVWSKEEIEDVLGSADAEKFSKTYDVRKDGNWEGENVLRLAHETPLAAWTDPEMKRVRKLLWERRALRPRPLRDEKVLVSWNAWMNSSLFQAAYAFESADTVLAARLRTAAIQSLEFLLRMAPDPQNLAHIYYGTQPFEEALLEDHAALLESLQMAAACSGLTHEQEERFASEFSRRFEWVETNFRDEVGRLLPKRFISSRFGAPWSDLQNEDGANPSAYSTYMGVLGRELMRGARSELETVFWKDLSIGSRISDRNPLILTYLLSQLEIVARGVVAKVPHAQRELILREASTRGLRPSEIMVVGHESADFELCEWGACFLKTSDKDELVKALAKRLQTQHT